MLELFTKHPNVPAELVDIRSIYEQAAIVEGKSNGIDTTEFFRTRGCDFQLNSPILFDYGYAAYLIFDPPVKKISRVSKQSALYYSHIALSSAKRHVNKLHNSKPLTDLAERILLLLKQQTGAMLLFLEQSGDTTIMTAVLCLRAPRLLSTLSEIPTEIHSLSLPEITRKRIEQAFISLEAQRRIISSP